MTLGFANATFSGAVLEAGADFEIGYEIRATDLSTGQPLSFGLPKDLGTQVISVSPDHGNKAVIYLVTKDDRYNPAQQDTYRIVGVNLRSGEAAVLYDAKVKTKASAPFMQVGTDVLGNLYVFSIRLDGQEKLLQRLIVNAKTGKPALASDAYTKSLNTFWARDTEVVSGITRYSPAKEYKIAGYYPAADGTIYVLGTNAGYKHARLFQACLTQDDKTANDSQYNFTAITSGKTEVFDVVPLNATNALIQVAGPVQRGRATREWKAYQSSSGSINTSSDNLLAFNYDSPFQLDTVSSDEAFRLPAGPETTSSVAGNANLSISYVDHRGRSRVSNLTPLLPMQPGEASSQLTEFRAKSLQVGTLSIEVVRRGNDSYLQVYSLVDGSMVSCELLGNLNDASQTSLLLEEGSAGTRLHLVTTGLVLQPNQPVNGSWRDLSIDHRVFTLRQDGDRSELVPVAETRSSASSWSINGGDGSDRHGEILAHLARNDFKLLAIDSGLQTTTYQFLLPQLGLVEIGSSEGLIGRGLTNALAISAPLSVPQYFVSSLATRLKNTWSDDVDSLGLVGDESAGNASFEWGTLPGFTIPSFVPDGWFEKKKSFPIEGNTAGKKFQDGAWEIEVKGGPKSWARAKDLKDKNTIKDYTTWAAELNLKAKVKLLPFKVDSKNPKTGKNSAKELQKIREQQQIIENPTNSQFFSENYRKLVALNAKLASDQRRTIGMNDFAANLQRIGNEQLLLNKAARETLIEYTKDKAKEELNKLKQGAELNSLEFALNLAGAWKYASDYRLNPFGNQDDLKQFKLDAGLAFGFKRPLVQLGNILSLYFIIGASIGVRWTQNFQVVETSQELESLLSALPIINELIEVVTLNGTPVNKLTPEQARDLQPSDVRWRYRVSPADILPVTLAEQMSTITKLTEAAGAVMMYIPPALYATLAMNLAGAVGLQAQETEEIPANSSPQNEIDSTVFQSLFGAASGEQLNQRPQQVLDGDDVSQATASTALKILESASDLTIDTPLQAGSAHKLGGFIKLKELGLQGALNLAQIFELEMKGFIGAEFEFLFDINDPKSGQKISVGIGADAKIKLFLFTQSVNFYWTFFQAQWDQKLATNGGVAALSRDSDFYGSSEIAISYQNLMASENFSPSLSVLAAPPALVSPRVPKQLESAFNPEIKFVDIFISDKNTERNAYGLYVEPIKESTSKTGLIVDVFLIAGRYNGNSIAWDPATIVKYDRGLFTDLKIQGSLYNPKTFQYLPVVTLSGIDASSPFFAEALKATSQISGTVTVLGANTGTGRLDRIAALTPDEENDASRFGQSNQVLTNQADGAVYIASAMPGKDFNRGGVRLHRFNPAGSPQALDSLDAATGIDTTFEFSSDPAQQVSFGQSTASATTLDGSRSALTIALDGGHVRTMPVAYTIFNPWLQTNKRTVELATAASATRFALMAGLSATDLQARRLSQISSTDLSSSEPSRASHWQAISYVGADNGLSNSVIQLSRADYKFFGTTNQSVSQESRQRNLFFTQASIDTALSTNDLFSGSLSAYRVNQQRSAFVVGGTGQALLLTLPDLVDGTASEASPFLRLNGLGVAPTQTLLVKFQTRPELSPFWLWLEFDTRETKDDFNLLSKEQLLNAVLWKSGTALGPYNYDYRQNILVTDNIQSILVDQGKISLTLAGKQLFDSSFSEEYELNNLGFQVVAPAESLDASSLIVRFQSNNQPLNVKAVTPFSKRLSDNGQVNLPLSQDADWLCVSTDDSDGHSLLYLVTDTSLIKASLQSPTPTTLWLDKYKDLGPSEASFKLGTSGLAFMHGSTLETYVAENGNQYLLIGDSVTSEPGQGVRQAGRIIQIQYDEVLFKYAESKSDPQKGIPLIDPVAYLKANPSKGSIITGDLDNGLFGQNLFTFNLAGEQLVGVGQPGILDAQAISDLQELKANTGLHYTPDDAKQPASYNLTAAGSVIDKTHIFANNDFGNQYTTQSLIYSVDSKSLDSNKVLNQDLYSFGLSNLEPISSRIPKDFNGSISAISSSPILSGGSEWNKKQLNLLVTDTVTGYNYPMFSRLTSESRDNQWQPVQVDWQAELLQPATTTYPSIGTPSLPQYPFSLELVSPNLTEGETVFATVRNLSEAKIYLEVRPEDISAYEGKDYRSDRYQISLDPGESSQSLAFRTLASDTFMPTRMFRLVAHELDVDGNRLDSYIAREIHLNSSRAMDFSKVGTGASVSSQDKATLAVATAALPSSGTHHYAALFSSKLDAQGQPGGAFISMLKHAEKNYEISGPDSSIKTNYMLPNACVPVFAQSLSLTGNSVLSYSLLNKNLQAGRVDFKKLPVDPNEVLKLQSDFFLNAGASLESDSPGFGIIIHQFSIQRTVSGREQTETYVAIADPVASAVYLVSADVLAELIAANSSARIADWIASNKPGVYQIVANTSESGIAFGQSLTTGQLHGRNVLVVGAPSGAEVANSGGSLYGGSVFIISLDDLLATKTSLLDLSLQNHGKNVSTIRINGLGDIDNDPFSADYLYGTAPGIGAATLFANIVDFKGKKSDQPQLLIGAPGFMTGDATTGAIFVLDPSSTALAFDANKSKTKVVEFKPDFFAVGQQKADLTGMTFVGDDGDRIGSTLLNLQQFTGGLDAGQPTGSKDVIAIPSPERFGGAGGVYVYIGNNNPHLALEQLNPASIYDHTFQYVGTVEGEDPSQAQAPLYQVGLHTNLIGKFSQPLVNAQGLDFAITVNNSSKPGAVLVYGKPYLYPGFTTSVFDIDAAGFAKPLVGSGLPVPIGDANLDGYSDYVLYATSLNGRTATGEPLDSSLRFGVGPTVLTDYDDRIFKTSADRSWQLQSNQAFGTINPENFISSQPIVGTSLIDAAALFSGKNIGVVDRSAYLGYASSVTSDTNIVIGVASPSIASGKFLVDRLRTDCVVAYSYSPNQGAISIQLNEVGSSQSHRYSVTVDTSNQRLTSLLPFRDSADSQSSSSFLMGVVKSVNGFAEYQVQKFSLLANNTTTAPVTLFVSGSQQSLVSSYSANARLLITGSTSFAGQDYITLAKTISEGTRRQWELSVVNLTTKIETVIDAGSVSDPKLLPWFSNLSAQALIAPLGDWNGDGTPELAYTKLRSDWQTLVNEGKNPFVNQIAYGLLGIRAKSPLLNRYSLNWSAQDSETIIPLGLQTPVQINSVGDVDGSGAASLIAAPLPKVEDLGSAVSNLFSFELFPSSEVLEGMQKVHGSEGADVIVMDDANKILYDKTFFSLQQGNDLLQLEYAALDYARKFGFLPYAYIAAGSGDDVIVVDGALLQPGSPYGDPQIDLFINGGSGFNTLRISRAINGNPRQAIDLTRLLNNASGLSEIVFQNDLELDLSRLRLAPPTFENADGIFLGASYGVKLTLRSAESMSVGQQVVRNGVNYVRYADAVSGAVFFIQQGIDLRLVTALGDSLPLAVPSFAVSNNAARELVDGLQVGPLYLDDSLRQSRFYNLGAGRYGLQSSFSPSIDDVTGVVQFSFRDASLSLVDDVAAAFQQLKGRDDVTGDLFRLYQTAFSRLPDPQGYRYWIDRASGANAASNRAVARDFLASEEFSSLYGSVLSDQGFLSVLYRNALGRAPDESGLAFYQSLLAGGTERDLILLDIAQSEESQQLFARVTGF